MPRRTGRERGQTEFFQPNGQPENLRRSGRERTQTEFFGINNITGKMNITNILTNKWRKGYVKTPDGNVKQLRNDAYLPLRLFQKNKPFSLHLEGTADPGACGRLVLTKMLNHLARLQPNWPVIIKNERQVVIHLRGRKDFKGGECEIWEYEYSKGEPTRKRYNNWRNKKRTVYRKRA